MTGVKFVRALPSGEVYRAMSGDVAVGLVRDCGPDHQPPLRFRWELYFTGRHAGREVGAEASENDARLALLGAWATFLDRAGLIPIDGRRVRHKARSSTYRVVGQATAQCSVPIRDGDPLTIYAHDGDNRLWGRPLGEFDDGRFEPVGSAT